MLMDETGGFECINGVIHVMGWCVSALELQQQLHSTLLKVMPEPACLDFFILRYLNRPERFGQDWLIPQEMGLNFY